LERVGTGNFSEEAGRMNQILLEALIKNADTVKTEGIESQVQLFVQHCNNNAIKSRADTLLYIIRTLKLAGNVDTYTNSVISKVQSCEIERLASKVWDDMSITPPKRTGLEP
jgi:ABC-type branched-subunit amino acid transport system substrate-binding protein